MMMNIERENQILFEDLFLFVYFHHQGLICVIDLMISFPVLFFWSRILSFLKLDFIALFAVFVLLYSCVCVLSFLINLKYVVVVVVICLCYLTFFSSCCSIKHTHRDYCQLIGFCYDDFLVLLHFFFEIKIVLSMI